MLEIARSVVVKRDVEDVFAYVADFSNFTAWSTDVVQAELLTDGPVGVGTQARIVRQAVGQQFDMLFNLVRYEPNQAIGFTGTLLGVPFSSHLHFSPLDLGTRVVQSGAVKVPAPLFFVEPTVRNVLANTFENDLRQLKRQLEASTDGNR